MAQVADVTYTNREEPLPERCPKCNADLRGPHAVVLFEYEVHRKTVTIDKDGTVNWDDHIYGPSEDSGVAPVEYQCAACEHKLLTGKEEEREA